MTNNKQNTGINPNNGVGTVVAAVAGAVIGAGIVAMGSEKNRKEAQEVVDKVKEKASTYMNDAQDQIDDGKAKLEKTAVVAKDSNQEVKKIWKK